MFSLVSVLGGFAVGRNLVASVAIGALAGGLGFGVGYVKGNGSAKRSAQVVNLKAQVRHLQTEIDRRELADKLAEEQAEHDAAAEQENDGVSNGVSESIARAPVVDGCATGDFLAGLRRLK